MTSIVIDDTSIDIDMTSIVIDGFWGVLGGYPQTALKILFSESPHIIDVMLTHKNDM